MTHPVSAQPSTFNQRQVAEFSQSLVKKIIETTNITNDNLSKARQQMKNTHDKHTKTVPISVGNHVMLWKPYKKSKISGCFQPNWSGPWVITQFTGPTNCKLMNDTGKTINVHINQLKIIEKRHTPQTLSDKSTNDDKIINSNETANINDIPTAIFGP